MVAIRSFVFTVLFFIWSIGSAFLFVPFFLLSSSACCAVGKPWARVSLWLAKVICGIRYEVRGEQHISPNAAIYASKHQSAWDTLIFLVLLDKPAYILKRELLRIPFWGWYLWRMEMVAIEREGKARTMKHVIKESKHRLEQGRSIVIFPEGTRTTPGTKPAYQPGVVALYSMLKTPVIPVALNSGMFWGKDALMKYAGTIVIEFLPPIAPGLAKETFQSQLESTIEDASTRLIQEAQQQKA